jgi:hypothetical protein
MGAGKVGRGREGEEVGAKEGGEAGSWEGRPSIAG